MQHSRICWRVRSLFAVAVLAGLSALLDVSRAAPTTPPAGSPAPGGGSPPAPPPGPMRLTRNLPGDSKAIILNADAITTWVEGNRRAFLLEGQVLVEQGVVQARFQQGVAWVDLDRLRRTRVLHVDVYAEGAVHLEQAAESAEGERALLDLNTRGELKLNANKSRVAQQVRGDAPLYLRALAEMAPPPDPAIRRTSAEEAAPPLPAAAPPPTTPVLPSQTPRLPSGMSAPASSNPLPVLPTPGSIVPTPLPVPTPPAPRPLPPPEAQAPPPTQPPRTWDPEAPTPAKPTAQAPPTPPSPPSETPPGPKAEAPPQKGGSPTGRSFSIAPRTAAPFQTQIVNLPNGEQALVVTGGVLLIVKGLEGGGSLDVAADRLVVWNRGNGQGGGFLNNLRGQDQEGARELELYMAGNVVLRSQTGEAAPGPPGPRPPGQPGPAPPTAPGQKPRGAATRTLRADEVYYDVSRNVAIATQADLELRQPTFPEPLHFSGVEVQQLSPTQFKAVRARLFSSRLPSDPGIDLFLREADLEERRVQRKGLLGTMMDRKTGQPVVQEEDIVTGRNVFFDIEEVPFFWLPFVRFDAREPLGPLQSASVGYNSIFGFQIGATLNLYDLLGIQPPPLTRWQLETDYLSSRGPALGTNYDTQTTTWFGLDAKNTVLLKAWGIEDEGTDQLGGGRGPSEHHPDWRGRVLFRDNVQDLPAGFTVQLQGAPISDKNFLEQYYKLEFDQDINQETYAYVKQSEDNWAWTLLSEPRIRNWVTETEWLPRANGYLIGESFFDRFTYSASTSLGYAHLETTHVPPPPVFTTDQSVGTGRFDFTQELSLPFYLGPVKMVPYGVLDLTYYTEDLEGQDKGRVYGGGGLRGSIPFTRLYPDMQSEWFNVNGINHKVVLSANYFVAQASTSHTNLPQLDRLNDDATDQALRDIKPLESQFDPAHGLALSTLPLYDPQLMAIRQLVMNRIDTRDDIDVLQLDLRQRWQTKRGYPGQQHIVDYMTLDLSGSYFPESTRDNFGHPFGLLAYDWEWNVGDRNGFESSGWMDPFPNGAKVWNFGAFFDRPDRTSLYLGYRYIDPLDSRLVIASLTAVLSPKYAVTAATSYDFGTNQAQSNTLILTRMGADVQVSVGVTYNTIQNSFGFLFEILPNAVAGTRHNSAMQALGGGAGTGLLGGR